MSFDLNENTNQDEGGLEVDVEEDDQEDDVIGKVKV